MDAIEMYENYFNFDLTSNIVDKRRQNLSLVV